MSRLSRITLGIVFIVAGMVVAYRGVSDINTAKNWLELTRGIFFGFLGAAGFLSGIEKVKEPHD